MVSTSGAQLLPEEAIQLLLKGLLPLTTVLTPNVPEAKLLLSKAGSNFNIDPHSVEDLIELGKQVHKLGPKYVLLKGGHLPLPSTQGVDSDDDKIVHNVFISDDGTAEVIQFPFIDTKNTHGTGCSLACE
jgi:hydroxymethylpyrimidine kinase/phosphomethylpyrimidine kinase